MKKLAYILSLALLTTCTNTFEAVKTGAKQDAKELRGKIANEIYPEGNYLAPAVTTRAYTYCYRSWADVSCYKSPVPGQDHLLVVEQ